MEPVPLLDCAGRRRSPATLSSFHQGRTPPNKGRRYPPDPPSVEEIIAVMRACGSRPEGVRAASHHRRALARRIADQRSARADRTRSGPPPRRRAGPARKGGKRREVGMDRWGWDQLDPRLEHRASLPVGALFCVLRGPTRGQPCGPAGIRAELHRVAAAAGVRRRFAPHQLRHAHAIECPARGSRCW